MGVEKAVPVVLRERRGRLTILMFRHPHAGLQLVKGTIEAGEEPGQAALRELHEESGIADAGLEGPIGCADDIAPGQNWHFFRCTAPNLPDRWSHHTDDDGGLVFRFFWQPIDERPSGPCDPIFRRALGFIRAATARKGREARWP